MIDFPEHPTAPPTDQQRPDARRAESELIRALVMQGLLEMFEMLQAMR